MSVVGIIANPASGKDIRRLIASGMVVTNQEKINIIVRMIKAMDSMGVGQVFIMPDLGQIAQKVIEELDNELATTAVDVLKMRSVFGTYKDTLRASEQMHKEGFDAIIVMGGDGTSRVVAKECGDVPLLPVSTGTNNVFPQMIEGTLAGLAAGAIANGSTATDKGCSRAPVLELRDEAGQLVDIALVDLVVVGAASTGSKAVWDPSSILELFLTRADPAEIGLSSIGGWLHPIEDIGQIALHVMLGDDGAKEVTAPIAPGLLSTVKVVNHKTFDDSLELPIAHTPCTIALDGEREVVLQEGQKMTVNLNRHGPLVVDVKRTLAEAARIKN